ncbi:putative membrane protein [Pullulanibacillus pueri]|uniref:Membrane protein n=1 Tax=Pullulanibacillus pueri TaxID=1437324 RepID=A0A8J3EJU5_9BACL|nr:DUF420 domain-containing protein [Pullulanibacillus pueri]MBM7680103.1 putative membrane protein [Pullulanibacillus pueri]GGH74374.1 membrane protein [Pullulanibacillus pueri]
MIALSAVLASISTLFIFLCGLFIAYGWIVIRKTKDRKRHKKIMVTAAVFALVFFVIYMFRTLFIGNVKFGGPDMMKLPYHLFLFFHIVFALLGAIFGLISLYLGNKNKIPLHRKISPYTAVIWFVTTITGIVVYVLLFLVWPGDMDTSLLNAVFGG